MQMHRGNLFLIGMPGSGKSTLGRLLANMGVESATPLLDRFHRPVDGTRIEKRWLDGLYLDQPQEWDDPYRFFRW